MFDRENEIVAGTINNGEEDLEFSLRPQRLYQYIGQNKVKEVLNIFIESAKLRNQPLDHVLLSGPPGLGKTTLANIISNEMGVNIRVTSGPAIERPGDLAAILTNLNENDILFIDEIHRLNKTVEEIMYPALEDYALDIIIGKGPSARSIRLDLPKFTLIGATTRSGMLASPLRDRFGVLCNLDFYNADDLKEIVLRSASIINVEINGDGAEEIARRSRGTPRIANRLLKRVRDYAVVKSNGIIDTITADKALKMLEIDEIGLDKLDRRILNTIIDYYKGG
ncbi:MAG: Holliday junction branch migration DNA helicase RuvB, partial [Sedimentibacter sp.]|uniref:Holliday junction branch migration DNA helicase RuvB n=1 Tax=Sedimentibacter sp. TaxID=1960295 RepID=UPI0029823338